MAPFKLRIICYRVSVLVISPDSAPIIVNIASWTNFAFQMVRLVRSLKEVKEEFRNMSFDGQHVDDLLDAGRWFKSQVWIYLVNCPTRWSLLLFIGYLCRSSSWRWWRHIRGCRLLRTSLRAGMRFLAHFFCKMYFLYVCTWRKIW